MTPWYPAPLDLRPVFAAALGLRTFMPGDEGEAGPSSAADTGSVVPPVDAAGEGDGDEDEPGELGAEDIKNPRLKQLHDEAGKHRRLRKEAERKAAALAVRVAELESANADEALREENRSLRLRMAWDRATADAKLRDGEVAWKLAEDDLKALEVKDGTVDTARLGEIVNHVIQRYPYLVAEDAPVEVAADAFPDTQPSGRRTDGKARVQGSTYDLAALQKKFPALRSR